MDTPFEFNINSSPFEAEKPEDVISHLFSFVLSIIFSKNSQHSSKVKSSYFLSYVPLTSFTFSIDANS